MNYALFVYNPMMNSTTFACDGSSTEALIKHAHSTFHDNLMFSIYKFRENKSISNLPATLWQLDTQFDGKSIAPYHRNFNRPMECAYQLDDCEWYFKTF